MASQTAMRPSWVSSSLQRTSVKAIIESREIVPTPIEKIFIALTFLFVRDSFASSPGGCSESGGEPALFGGTVL